MNSPFLVVSLTNQSPARCHLRGYPIIATAARRAYTHEKSRSLDITLRRGSIYERHDPGPGRVELEPHGKAFFGLGTGTGWSPQVYERGQGQLATTYQGVTAVRVSTGFVPSPRCGDLPTSTFMSGGGSPR